MTLHKDIQFDQGEERVYGPNNNAQVAMVRGLLRNFIQPVFYDFDQPMTSEILTNIMHHLDNIGLHVEGIVCDLGLSNQSLFRELGASHEQPWFLHKEKEVNVFADIPHMLKLLRNHFLDDGFALPSGTHFKKQDLQRLLTLDAGELKMCHKLKDMHFTCQGQLRQNVALAAELFSHSTASAYKLVFGGKSPQEKERSDVIELVDQTFDILNSRAKEGHKKWDFALGWSKGGRNLEDQRNILMKAKDLISGMRMLYVNKNGLTVPKKNILPFQRGFLMSIDSALRLLDRMRTKYGAKYLLTSRCNSDVVENLFSRIRYISGADTHPSSVDFKNRLRLVVLGQSAEYVIKTASVQFLPDEEETVILSQQLVDGLGVNQSDCPILSSYSLPDDAVEEESEGILETVIEIDIPLSVPLSEQQQGCATEALKYIAGYIAFKKRKDHPHLGEDGTLEPALHCPWIDIVSHGGLTKPSASWFKQVLEFEREFQRVHGSKILREENIIKNVCESFSKKFCHVPVDLISFYVKFRTHARIKYLRRQYKSSSEQQRNRKKRKHFAT